MKLPNAPKNKILAGICLRWSLPTKYFFQISMQSVYAAFEGTAMRQCREYNSDFSWVVFYSSIGSVIGPFLASVTIEDAVEGSGGKILRVSLFPSGFYCFFRPFGYILAVLGHFLVL